VRPEARDHAHAERQFQAKVISLAGELSTNFVTILGVCAVLWAYERGHIAFFARAPLLPFFFVGFLVTIRAALVEIALIVVGRMTGTNLRRLTRFRRKAPGTSA
jgi:hypothetical protein